MDGLQVAIDGAYLEAIMPWGDLEWSTVWPGGSDSLTFTPARSHRLFRPDAIVELMWEGECMWCGTMLDPTRGAPIVAEGLHRKAEDYPALDFFKNAILDVGDAVDSAIVRGMPWRWPTPTYRYQATGFINPPGGSPNVPLDPTQPHSTAQLLDATALAWGYEWGVGPDRLLRLVPWPAAPSFHLLPGIDGLGITRDGYADNLFARYQEAGTGLFKTVEAHDLAAHERWGHVERTITQPLAEGAPLTTAQAQEIVDGLMARGASQIGWTSPIEVQFGDVVNEYQEPIDIRKITAGQMGVIHGLVEDVADLAGATRTNLPVARVSHKGATATIEPRGLVSPMNDVLAGVS